MIHATPGFIADAKTRVPIRSTLNVWSRSGCASLGGAICAVMLLLTAGAQAQNLFILTQGSSPSVLKIDDAGNMVPFIAPDSNNTNGIPRPCTGMAFDHAGNLYVSGGGLNNGVIAKFDASGNLISTNVMPGGLLKSPAGIAFDRAGNLFVANASDGNILEYTPDGYTFVFASGFKAPKFLAFDGAGLLYVSDQFLVANVANTYIYQLGTNGVVMAALVTGFSRIGGMAFDGAGNLFVENSSTLAKSGVRKVVNFSTLTAYGPARLTMLPVALAFDGAGNLYAVGGASIDKIDTSESMTATSYSALSSPTAMAFQPTLPVFSALNSGQSISRGATNLTLSGYVYAFSTNTYTYPNVYPYGMIFPAPGETVTVTINGKAQTATINDLYGDFSINYDPSTLPVSNTPYTITYSYAGDLLLFPTTDTNGTLTVLGTLFSGLTASQSSSYGATNLMLNGTISSSGPVFPTNGETVAISINGEVQTATINDDTGDFSIHYNPATIPASATPYTITYSYAGDDLVFPAIDSSTTLTVTPGTPPVTWTNPAPITYGAVLTTNELNAVASVPGNWVYSPTNGTTPDTGTNTLTVVFTPTDTLNYAGTTNSASVVVMPAPLTVTAANTSRIYGQTNPVFEGTILGITNNDQFAVNFSCNASSNSGAGTYAIVPSLVEAANRLTNYTVSLIAGTLTVNPAVLTVTVNDTNRPYGQTNPAFTFACSGFVNGEDSAALAFPPVVNTVATIASPAGAYPLFVTAGRDGNYDISPSPGVLTVVAVLTVSAEAGFFIAGHDPVLVDTNSAVNDGGGVNFDGAMLSFTIVTNATSNDSLVVQAQGVADGQIGLQEGSVTYSGVVFATCTGGEGSNAICFTFNTNATSVAVTALMRQVAFGTTDTAGLTRSIDLTLAYDNFTLTAQRLLRMNQAPVAAADAVMAAAGAVITIPFAQLLANDSDPDADTLTITITNSLSAQGAALTSGLTGVTYLALTNPPASDSFTYVLEDGHGGQARAEVTITFLPVGKIGLNLSDVNGAGAKLTMAGIPGGAYQIQASTDLLTWDVINTVMASPTGIIEILDAEAKERATRFYRAVAEPMD